MEEIIKIIDLIDKSIKLDPENIITGGNIIADNYDQKVDEYRSLVNNSKDWLSVYQSNLITELKIPNLKIKYMPISGYFIEVSKSQSTKVPTYFIHKQTLINASRFITPDLISFQNKLFEAESELANREYEIFLKIREEILNSFKELKKISINISYVDFYSSFAFLAYENNYVKPEILTNYDLEIIGGRHPVIETIEKDFIKNDLYLSQKKFVNVITGPNMGGKSTYLRQNALILIMAHLGSFVPAISAKIPVIDKIFSRVGASDNLFLGQSTFMVEMQEVANILNNSTKNSFVIIDEIGRGTSTYDGMSLAWGILKFNHDKIKAKTLFATHYHELVDESKILSGVSNFSVAVGENDENLIFLRKIIPGSIKKSYGIEVAKLAGISHEVIFEAKQMLKILEIEHSKKCNPQLTLGNFIIEPEVKIIKEESKIEEEIKKLDLNNLTPMEALNKLSELKGKIK